MWSVVHNIADLTWRLGAFGTVIWMFAGLAGGFSGCTQSPNGCDWVPYVVGIPTLMWLIGGLIYLLTSGSED